MEEKEIVSEVTNQREKAQETGSSRKSSRESWYGTSLLIVFIGIICVLLGAIGWWSYTRVYLFLQQEKTSISGLSQESLQLSEEQTVTPSVSDMPEEQVVEEVPDIKQESILVLNGGGTKGSAGEVVAVLKKEGYSKVSPGNTQKDYAGVTLYFAPQKEAVAHEVKKVLLKRYPTATSQESKESDKETTGASVVVIIGK
jgi:hypothetical protein